MGFNNYIKTLKRKTRKNPKTMVWDVHRLMSYAGDPYETKRVPKTAEVILVLHELLRELEESDGDA